MAPRGSLNSPKLSFVIIRSRILELLVENVQTDWSVAQGFERV